MLSLFTCFKKPPADDLLTSRLHDESTFYKHFVQDVKQCKEELIIESPYLTCKRAAIFIPLFKKLTRRGVTVIINTRHPDDHEAYLRAQALMAINKLEAVGAKINLFSNYHHRKIAVIDQKILWEGSLNILSQNNSREVMRRIESESLAVQMIHFLDL